MHLTNDHPSPEWIQWAEAESVRRLKLHLAEVRARKAAAQTESLERSFSSWADVQEELELEVQVQKAEGRVIRVHAENLTRA